MMQWVLSLRDELRARNMTANKDTECSSRGSRFSSQHSHGSLQLSVFPVPGNPTPSLRHTCRHTPMHIKNLKKSRRQYESVLCRETFTKQNRDELSTQQWHLKWGRPQHKAGREFCAEGTAQSKFPDNNSWAENTHSASPAFSAAECGVQQVFAGHCGSLLCSQGLGLPRPREENNAELAASFANLLPVILESISACPRCQKGNLNTSLFCMNFYFNSQRTHIHNYLWSPDSSWGPSFQGNKAAYKDQRKRKGLAMESYIRLNLT